MNVMQGHIAGAVAKQSLDQLRIRAVLRKPGSDAMSQVVRAKPGTQFAVVARVAAFDDQHVRGDGCTTDVIRAESSPRPRGCLPRLRCEAKM